jgi:hypothetical protein
MTSDDVTSLRLANLERAVNALAAAAEEQVAFNASVRAWGRAGLLLYGTGQAVLVGVLLYGVQSIGGA